MTRVLFQSTLWSLKIFTTNEMPIFLLERILSLYNAGQLSVLIQTVNTLSKPNHWHSSIFLSALSLVVRSWICTLRWHFLQPPSYSVLQSSCPSPLCCVYLFTLKGSGLPFYTNTQLAGETATVFLRFHCLYSTIDKVMMCHWKRKWCFAFQWLQIPVRHRLCF